MSEHPPRNDDKKSAKQRGGRSHPKGKGTIDALVAELNNIQSRNSLKKVGADVVTPEGAAAAGIGDANAVPPELKQIYGDAPVPPDKLAILAKIKGKEKIASFLAQTAADVAERKSSAENAEVKPPQAAPVTAGPTLAEMAGTVPNERQQNKFLKALLAEEGEIDTVLNAAQVDITPDEREEALAILRDPIKRGRANQILDKITEGSGRPKAIEYDRQLQLMIKEAEESRPAPNPVLNAIPAAGAESIAQALETPIVETEREIEKTPEKIAEENRREALAVPEKFEDKDLKEIKESHDQIHQLLKRMSEDPEVTFNAKDAHFIYRIVIPSRDEKGNLTATSETAYTYHDLLRLRASIPEELRKESDKTVWDWKRSGKWGKIETFANTEKLWNRLDNPNDKLSKYKNEFYSLLEIAKCEQLPDEYAEAVIRGDIEREVLAKQDELFARLQTADAAWDVLYERTKERDKTPEEQKEIGRVLGEKAEAEVALRGYMKVTDKYEPDPLETAPLNDLEKVRAREDELWKEFSATREMESLDNFKRADVLKRQWSGLRGKLENAPADGGVKVILGPEDVRQKRVQFNLLKKNLSGQNKELGTRAKEYGIKFESFVRNTGERYRKLPLKYKIGVAGALLGLNVATGGASTLVTLLTSTAMLGQRALGAASAYALIDGLYEKRLTRKEKERGSERTEFEKWKKRGYSTAAALAVFTGLPGYAVKEGFDAIGGSGMLKALGALMGISPAVTELPPTIPAPTGQSAEEATRIMEQAKEQLAKEITARDEIQAGLDQVKQQIAEEKARMAAEASTPQESRQALRTAVEKLTRVSATTDAKFEMPKHADFTYHGDDDSLATDLDYDVTPTDQSGADDDIVQVSEKSQPVAEPEAVTETTRSMPVSQEAPAESIESQPEAVDEPLPNVKVPEPERYATMDLTQEQASAETPTEAPTPAPEVITNSLGLKIPTAKPHIYAGADAGHTFAFGGTPAERANTILQYLRENPNKVVFGPDDTNTYRIPWHLVEGKLTPGVPMRTNGLFGFLSTWMKPPGPEDFEKIIK